MTSLLRVWWRGLGFGRWPSLALVVIALLLTILYQPMPLGWTDHGERTLGPHRVRLSTQGAVRPGRTLSLRLDLVPTPGRLSLEIVGGPHVAVEPAEGRYETALQVPESEPHVVIRVYEPGAAPDRDVRWDLGFATAQR